MPLPNECGNGDALSTTWDVLMPAREQVQKIQGFGLRLRSRLATLQMTQTTLAARTGLSRPTIHRVIHEDEATSRVLKKIAVVVGMDLLSVDVGAPALALPSAREEPRRTEEHAIPSGAPDDATEMAGVLTPMGEVLEILRRDDGMTQESMADEAGISLATYRRLITGAAKPKETWLRRWADAFDTAYATMLALPRFEGGDATAKALGRQLHAWRVSAGLDLIDVADAFDGDVVMLARCEAGDDENITFLGDLAALYGTSSEVIYRAAILALPEGDREADHTPVERVLTYEAAGAHARQQQEEREHYRADGGWGIERAFHLGTIRLRRGYDEDDAAARLGVSTALLERWENDDREPTQEQLERLAILYRSTPWELRYGDAWARAMAFPNADESRALIFGRIFPPEMRAWMYRVLAEFAAHGLDDIELMSVRETLTHPNHYIDVVLAESPEEAERFVWAVVVDTATDVWRNVTDPGWVERPASTRKPLPAAFTPAGFDAAMAEQLRADLHQRRMQRAHETARVAMNGGTPEEIARASAASAAARPDVFSFSRRGSVSSYAGVTTANGRSEGDGAPEQP